MKIVYGLVCLIVLIIFHEFGHFLAAKLFGVKVEAFSVGFGPVLLHRKIRGTDYRLSLLPLGGYCAMKGEKEFSESLKANLAHIEAEPDSLYGAHPLKRIIIAAAGPFANFLFAFLAFFIIALSGYSYYSYSSKIILADELYPEIHSAAREAGLLTGDIITGINGKDILTFSDILAEVSARPDENLEIKVSRNGKEMTFTVRTELDKTSGAGKIGVSADTETLEKFEEKSKSFFPALKKGISDAAEAFYLTVKGVFTLFKGANLSDSVSGPARVIDMLGGVAKESFSDSFRSGVVNVLNFMAYISVSLCFMNLLPVPVLDGGLILFAFIELVSRRKLPPKALYYIQFAGIAFILLVFMVGFTGDIKYFAGRFKGN